MALNKYWYVFYLSTISCVLWFVGCAPVQPTLNINNVPTETRPNNISVTNTIKPVLPTQHALSVTTSDVSCEISALEFAPANTFFWDSENQKVFFSNGKELELFVDLSDHVSSRYLPAAYTDNGVIFTPQKLVQYRPASELLTAVFIEVMWTGEVKKRQLQNIPDYWEFVVRQTPNSTMKPNLDNSEIAVTTLPEIKDANIVSAKFANTDMDLSASIVTMSKRRGETNQELNILEIDFGNIGHHLFDYPNRPGGHLHQYFYNFSTDKWLRIPNETIEYDPYGGLYGMTDINLSSGMAIYSGGHASFGYHYYLQEFPRSDASERLLRWNVTRPNLEWSNLAQLFVIVPEADSKIHDFDFELPSQARVDVELYDYNAKLIQTIPIVKLYGQSSSIRSAHFLSADSLLIIMDNIEKQVGKENKEYWANSEPSESLLIYNFDQKEIVSNCPSLMISTNKNFNSLLYGQNNIHRNIVLVSYRIFGSDTGEEIYLPQRVITTKDRNEGLSFRIDNPNMQILAYLPDINDH